MTDDPGPMTGAHRAEGGSPPKLLDRVQTAVRLRHYSRRTEKAYVDWIRRYILFHQKKRLFVDLSAADRTTQGQPAAIMPRPDQKSLLNAEPSRRAVVHVLRLVTSRSGRMLRTSLDA